MNRMKNLQYVSSVLARITDENLVRMCRFDDVSIVMMNPDGGRCVLTPERIDADTARSELCRRYRPLILKYANKDQTRTVRDDAEAFLWMLFIDAIYRFDLDGHVPFAGFIKTCIFFGHMNYFKRMRRQWRAETHIPETADEDDVYTFTMDRVPDETDVAGDLGERAERRERRISLVQALRRLNGAQRKLLHQLYVENLSYADIGRREGCTRQAIRSRHKRILKCLQDMIHIDNPQ